MGGGGGGRLEVGGGHVAEEGVDLSKGQGVVQGLQGPDARHCAPWNDNVTFFIWEKYGLGRLR